LFYLTHFFALQKFEKLYSSPLTRLISLYWFIPLKCVATDIDQLYGHLHATRTQDNSKLKLQALLQGQIISQSS